MTQEIAVSKLQSNSGQIEGLPKNPRIIKDWRYNALKKSIQESPEMLSLRELIVYPHNGKYVIICGNMRFRVCLALGYKSLPCKVLPEDTEVRKLREYTIKDNVAFGSDDYDILANEWEVPELEGYGMEVLMHDYDLNEVMVENTNGFGIKIQYPLGSEQEKEIYEEVVMIAKEYGLNVGK